MSKDERRVPELRFKGFFDDWEQRKFSRLVKRVSNTSEKMGLPRVEYEDIISGQGKLNNDVSLKNNRKRGNKFKTNDILFGKLRPYLNKWLVPDFEGIAVGDFWVLRPYRIESKFVYYLIQTAKFRAVSNISTGTRMPRSDWNVVSNSQFYITKNNNEAKLISKLLETLDNLISLHQRKINILKQLKQQYLSLIFPSKNKNLPDLRFRIFKEKWEKRKLKELLRERNEKTTESIDYPLMSFVQSKGVVSKGERYNREFLVKDKQKKYKKTELGDFIYSSNNLETGSIGVNEAGKAIISPVYSIFYSKTHLESEFVGYLSLKKDFVNEMLRYRQGVVYGQWRIHERDFLNIKITIPSDKEQKKIINLFKHLDKSIRLHHAKIAILDKLKQLYLQKMFL